METDIAEQRQQIQFLLDSLPDEKILIARGLIAGIADPLSVALARAPYDDEPNSAEEEMQVAASREWLRNNKPIPHEEVLAEYGLGFNDFK